MNNHPLTHTQRDELLSILQNRFEQNMHRHTGVEWSAVHAKLTAPENADKLLSLNEMELTGGEPDVVGTGKDIFQFFDCAAESPKGRRSLCYDHAALEARKEHKPANSAMNMAAEMGITLLSPGQYQELQQYGAFDTKTSSWVATPASIRQLGGALFCDRRYNTVFQYHNGAESYYAARGFRAFLQV